MYVCTTYVCMCKSRDNISGHARQIKFFDHHLPSQKPLKHCVCMFIVYLTRQETELVAMINSKEYVFKQENRIGECCQLKHCIPM